ncbi:class I SAM-dependent DNA methyltransferase [Devosia sp. MC521]|uniref:class I SAM-dependent DNA methyltransferase n=1 Tax=Devosia sp. MC521 TaxID=2759954 RepID=UPI0015F84CDE|nr:class I SAM-dependent DNA methyltransferase [Devosia sp. MC521]MBJ6986271.1 class I SAM-dependent DNA methyltransferase [Devosia sp. MC521]QMW64246.1 class I SAM-dependent DNA methyltransferase [Devosia sp. MC521]
MNAVEIEQAVSQLAEAPFDGPEFPYAFLQAFGNKETTLRKLRAGNTNKSDVGGVLQTNNIHIAVAPAGQVGAVLQTLRDSPATTKAKAKFILATDGDTLEAEDLVSGETIACDYADFPNHFGFFLPLAGITTVKQIRESSFDIRATSRLNRLYVELLKDNKDWAQDPTAMNHFMARLIFCFFAEDTDIFQGTQLFTSTIERMSDRDSTNTHEVISEIFRAMNTHHTKRGADLPRWAAAFPYVNGGLFAGDTRTPRFSRIARSFLMHIGNLDWRKINPDIFGSMIQAVADDEERGALGMHYTSVPNILKVLNPLFLDDLRAQLEAAGDSPAKLRNLRKRLAKIRVFDPACGSGNFLVISYKELRQIEAEINRRLGDQERRTDIRLTNFRGIELREFPAEIARLALIIAEYQCDVLYRGQKEALQEFLPLDSDNWITCGNALRLDWLSICPPTGSVVKHRSDDLLQTPLDQPEIDFENEGGETYICGNPPYLGSTWQTTEQKSDLQGIFAHRTSTWKSLDYVSGWFMKAADYTSGTKSAAAFVATNSICQGQQVSFLWPLIFQTGNEISFAYASFKWSNLASNKAGVTVVIVGISATHKADKRLYTIADNGETAAKEAQNINPYLVSAPNIIVEKAMRPMNELATMDFGNKADDGGHLTLTPAQLEAMKLSPEAKSNFIKKFYGSREFINGETRHCIWIEDDQVDAALEEPDLASKIDKVREARLSSKDAYARSLAVRSHQFKSPRRAASSVIVTPRVSSENRPYLPVGLMNSDAIIGDRNFAIYDGPIWNLALIASRLHWVWVGTVCVRMRTDFSYSNTLGWNTFPLPKLTEKNKADLTKCAEDILLAREAHFPKTIADLYDPEQMPDDLRAAHDRNDEVLERIYIGRRFRNDTERLEKLFDLYTKMTANSQASAGRTRRARA